MTVVEYMIIGACWGTIVMVLSSFVIKTSSVDLKVIVWMITGILWPILLALTLYTVMRELIRRIRT